MSDTAEDLDALFEEISAQHPHADVAPPSAVVADATVPAAANDTSEDLEALFDEISTQCVETSAATPAVQVEAMPVAEENLADKPMFDRLGGIVRMLHDSMRELGYDRALSGVVTQIPDARARLEYIATLTEQAANKVLNATEAGMPQQEALSRTAQDMDMRWAQLLAGKLSIEEFKTLAADSKRFAADVVEATEAEKARLLEIMMAQDFQDLTGQLIKKVVAITQTVEHELAQLLRDNAPGGLKEKPAHQHQHQHDAPVDLMQGPSAPTSAMDQDDVDNLLDDLGF